jgi:hypothetical protein
VLAALRSAPATDAADLDRAALDALVRDGLAEVRDGRASLPGDAAGS